MAMTTLTITLNSICAGGNHLHFTVSINGGAAHVVDTDTDTIFAALTDDEKSAFVKACVKLYKVGRTNAATKTAFKSGVTVTL